MTTIYQSFVTSLKEESHHVIVVQDSANALGRSLTLGTAICHDLQDDNGVPMILCSETPSRVRSHSPPVVIKSVEQVHGLLDNAEVLFLHSLTPLLINASTRQIVRLFQHVKEKNRKLVATIHEDCHDSQTVGVLKQHSDIWLSVAHSTFEQTLVTRFHSKGKVETVLYDFTIDHVEGKMKSIVESKSVVKSKAQTLAKSSEDEAANTLPISSFNLSLSDKEKEDRQQLEMPFWKKQTKIEYIPDENDDWDEEDPDDDLDF